jgi:hypothetical protein
MEPDTSAALTTEPRWKYVHRVTLPIYEHDTETVCAPPRRVVMVDVVAERVFLTVADYTEDSTTTTTKAVTSEAVSAEALLLALISQMGVEYVQGLLRRVES